jgi:hypothetical protein
MSTLSLNDLLNIEGEAESMEAYYCSMQIAINSLEAWKMQGSMGRAMMEAIKDGRCMLGLQACKDFWGGRIPSRFDIVEGSVGSREFVIESMGMGWADMLEGV